MIVILFELLDDIPLTNSFQSIRFSETSILYGVLTGQLTHSTATPSFSGAIMPKLGAFVGTGDTYGGVGSGAVKVSERANLGSRRDCRSCGMNIGIGGMGGPDVMEGGTTGSTFELGTVVQPTRRIITAQSILIQ